LNKLKYIDAIRGLAALIVVLRHFRSAFFPYSAFGATTFGQYFPHSALEIFLSETMPGLLTSGNFSLTLFFVLSGYVLSFKLIGKPNVRSRVLGATLKRPVRLVGLIWLSIILAYILWKLGWYYNQEIAPLTSSVPWFSSYWGDRVPVFLRFLRDLVFYPFSKGLIYNGPLWMMDVELDGSMLTFAYVFLLGDRRFRLWVLVPGIVLLWGTYHAGFALGILCGEIELIIRQKGVKVPEILPIFLVIAGIIIGNYPPLVTEAIRTQTIYGFFPPMEFVHGYPMIGGVMIFLALLLSPWLQSLLSRDWLATLGHISYSVFALHFLVLGSFASLTYSLLYSKLGHNAAALISISLSIPLILVLAKLTTRWVDDNVSRLADEIGRRGEKFFSTLAVRAQEAIRRRQASQ
jgi:peptidoglycan/LPS O-acetylase OafA/YrhL